MFKGLSSLGHWASSFDELAIPRLHWSANTSVSPSLQQHRSLQAVNVEAHLSSKSRVLLLSPLVFACPCPPYFDLKKGEAMRSPSFVFKEGEGFESFIWR